MRRISWNQGLEGTSVSLVSASLQIARLREFEFGVREREREGAAHLECYQTHDDADCKEDESDDEPDDAPD